jgi:hypothetical protein
MKAGEYCAKEGASILTVFVTVINEVYKRRIVINKIHKIMNNLVDKRWLQRSCSFVEGGTDGKILRFRK